MNWTCLLGMSEMWSPFSDFNEIQRTWNHIVFSNRKAVVLCCVAVKKWRCHRSSGSWSMWKTWEAENQWIEMMTFKRNNSSELPHDSFSTPGKNCLFFYMSFLGSSWCWDFVKRFCWTPKSACGAWINAETTPVFCRTWASPASTVTLYLGFIPTADSSIYGIPPYGGPC